MAGLFGGKQAPPFGGGKAAAAAPAPAAPAAPMAPRAPVAPAAPPAMSRPAPMKPALARKAGAGGKLQRELGKGRR